jgi:hypothetical protein
MIKKLILSILFPAIIFASSLKINDKISNFSLTDQFDKIHTINSGISTIIVTFQKDTLAMINSFLSSKNEDFLENNHAVFISNITSNPSIITKMFTIPHLRDYKYTILLVYDENSIKFLKEENKATIYSISNGQINNIQYISSKNELEKFFN